VTVRRCDSNSYTLAANLSASGASVAIPGGEYIFMAEGTVTGATISLQIQSPNGTWEDLSVYSGSKVSATALPFAQTGVDLPACNVRMAATGGTPTGLYAYLVGLG
jgi:hypothetical protein